MPKEVKEIPSPVLHILIIADSRIYPFLPLRLGQQKFQRKGV